MEKYLSPDEAAAMMPGVTRKLLAQLRFAGTGPRYARISPRKIVYSETAIAEFLAAREQQSTRENTAV